MTETIRIPHHDEEDLVYWANKFYEGDMGRRSTQGGIQSALEHGGYIGRAPSDGISDRAFVAAARLRRIMKRLEALTDEQRHVLRQAMLVRDLRGGLSAYGTYPGAVFACPEVIDLFRADGGPQADPRHLTGWLASLAQRATATGKRNKAAQKAEAQALVARIRTLATARLVDALQAYGCAIDGQPAPKTVTAQELAQRLGVDESTVRRQIMKRKVRRIARRDGWRIVTSDLALKWPEAA